MNHLTSVNPEQFEERVINAKGLKLVDFYAEWCGPCKVMDPVMDQLQVELKGQIDIVKVNVDDYPEIPARFAVRGMPTLMIFKDGHPEDVIVGAQGYKSLRERLKKHLSPKN